MEAKNHSSVNLLGKSNFLESDPIWYRIFVLLIQLAALIALGFILKEWAIPVIGASKAGSLIEFFKMWKGRSP